MFGNLGQLQSNQITAGSLGVSPPVGQFSSISSIQPPSFQAPSMMPMEPQFGSNPMSQYGSVNAPTQLGSMNVPAFGSMNVPSAIGFGAPLGQQLPADGHESPPSGIAFPAQQPQPMESFQFGIEAPAFNFGNYAFTAPPVDTTAVASGFTFGMAGPTSGFEREPAPVIPDPYPVESSKRSPRFGEPGYKSPFDTTSPFEPTYKSLFETPATLEPSYDTELKDTGFSYASPQADAPVDNGPWTPPDLDRTILEAHDALLQKPLGECWIRVKETGRKSSQQSTRVKPADGVTTTLVAPRQNERAKQVECMEVYQDDQDPWIRPSCLSKEETEAFWSQSPQAMKAREAMFAPKKNENPNESDWVFLGRMMKDAVGGWIEETKEAIVGPAKEEVATKTRGLTLNGVEPRTKLDLDNCERNWRTDQMATMPLVRPRDDALSRSFVPVRHWWTVQTIHEKNETQRKFSDKLMNVYQPKDCSHIMPEALLRSFGISTACKKGTKDAPNHDGFSICRFDESYMWGALTLFCVFDGHGSSGEVITDLCCDLLPKLLFEQFKRLAPNIPPEGLGYVRTPEELEHVRSAVEEVFVMMQQFLEQLTTKGTICSRKSGSTATLLLQGVEKDMSGNEDPWLLVGHVGDTRAVLLRPTSMDDMRGGRDYNPESPEVLELTRDHRPDNPREKQRIELTGARVEAFSVEKGTVRPMDPRVVSDGQTWPALNMSRCLGDMFSHTQGVTELPEVRIKDVQFGDKVIICTDGVWDVISPSEAQTIVQEIEMRSPGSCNAADTITNEARKRWLDKTGDFYDDITCVVINVCNK